MTYTQTNSMYLFSVSSKIFFSHFSDALITGSWDRTLRFWDPRANTPQQGLHQTPERIYAIDHVNNTLVVAMASRLFHIYDIRKMDVPAQQRESSLKYMTRSLTCMPDGQGSLFLFFFFLFCRPFHLFNATLRLESVYFLFFLPIFRGLLHSRRQICNFSCVLA